MQALVLIILFPAIILVAIMVAAIGGYVVIFGILAFVLALFLQYVLGINVFGAFEGFLQANQNRKDQRLSPEKDTLGACIIADLSDRSSSYVLFLKEIRNYSYDNYRHEKVITLDLLEIEFYKEQFQVKETCITYGFDKIKSIVKDLRRQGRSRIYVNMTEYDIVVIPSESPASSYVNKLVLLIEDALKFKKIIDQVKSDLTTSEEKISILEKSDLEGEEIKKLAIKIEAMQHKHSNANHRFSRNMKLIEKMAIPIMTSNANEVLDRLNSQYLKFQSGSVSNSEKRV